MSAKSCDEIVAFLNHGADTTGGPSLHPLEADAWKSSTILSTEDHLQLVALRDQCSLASNDLSLRLGELRKALELLERMKSEQDSRLARLCSATAVWKRLPWEVLSQIFETLNEGSAYYAPRAHWSRGSRQPRMRSRPEHVCSFWRQIVFKTPTLFHELRINFRPYILNGNPDELFSSTLQSILPMVRSLVIDFRYMSFQGCAICLEHLDLPKKENLQALTVYHDQTTQGLVDRFAALLLSLPLLVEYKDSLRDREYDSFRVNYHFQDGVQELSWDRLTTLDIGGLSSCSCVSVGSAHYLLSRCMALTRCVLGLRDDEYSPDLPTSSNPDQLGLDGQTITLSALLYFELRIRDRKQDIGHRFLLPLILPSLAKLVIFGGATKPQPFNIGLFLRRSACDLQAIQLHVDGYDEDELTEVLGYLSGVRTLTMRRTRFPSAILQGIADRSYLPKLSRLQIRISEEETAVQDIVELAEARWDNSEGGNIERLIGFTRSSSSFPLPKTLSEKWQSQGRKIRIDQLD